MANTIAPFSAATVNTLLTGQKAINYWPFTIGIYRFWEEYNGSQVTTDFNLIVGAGFNTVRVTVAPAASGYPAVTPTFASNLNDFLSRASTAGLKIKLTLFDQFVWYGDITGSTAHVQSLWNSITGTTATASTAATGNRAVVTCIDIHNEIDTTNSLAMTWAQAMLPITRTICYVPVTVSTILGLGSANAISTIAGALNGVLPDFYDGHYYMGQSAMAYQVLSGAKSQASGVPLAIGECGTPVTSLSGVEYEFGTPQNQTALEANQEAYFRRVALACQQLSLPYAAPWVFVDWLGTQRSTVTASPTPTTTTCGVTPGTGQYYRVGAPITVGGQSTTITAISGDTLTFTAIGTAPSNGAIVLQKSTFYPYLSWSTTNGGQDAQFHMGFWRIGSPQTARPVVSTMTSIMGGTAIDTTFNGGFETSDGGTYATLWRQYVPMRSSGAPLSPAAAATFTRDTTTFHTGTASMKLSAVSQGGTGWTNAFSTPSPYAAAYITPIATVKPGDSHTATCYAKGDGGTGGTAALTLYYFDANYVCLGTATVSSATFASTTTAWTQLSVTATAPSGAYACEIHCEILGTGYSGSFWFDDVTFA